MGLDNNHRARIILEAVRLASTSEISSLHQLIAREPETLQLELVLRILLTYLPESTEPSLYIDLLHQLVQGAAHAPPPSSLRPSRPDEELSNDEARYKVRQLHLLPLAEEKDLHAGCSDILSLFLVHRSRRIDIETGSIPQIQELLEPFIARDPYIRTWLISNVLPLQRLNFEYYPHDEDAYTIETFEKLEGRPAIDSLLARSARVGNTEATQCARDIKYVVGPWIYGENTRKRRKTHHDRRRSSLTAPANLNQSAAQAEDSTGGWSDVNEWILNLAGRNISSAAGTIKHWDGPLDVDYGGYENGEWTDDENRQRLLQRYARTGLATVYAHTETSIHALEETHTILSKVARISGLEEPPALQESPISVLSNIPEGYLDQLSGFHLFHNALLRSDNPMTSPAQVSLSFASLLVRSCFVFAKLGNPKSCKAAAELALFTRREEQVDELHKTLQKVPVKTRDESSWTQVRHQILWLRDWQYQSPENAIHDTEYSLGVFGKIKKENVEVELLRALLRASCKRHKRSLFRLTAPS